MSSCDPAHKKPQMETACSIIPDTGTTLVVGPEAQIASLFEDGDVDFAHRNAADVDEYILNI